MKNGRAPIASAFLRPASSVPHRFPSARTRRLPMPRRTRARTLRTAIRTNHGFVHVLHRLDEVGLPQDDVHVIRLFDGTQAVT
jgi:hypothetical protein